MYPEVVDGWDGIKVPVRADGKLDPFNPFPILLDLALKVCPEEHLVLSYERVSVDGRQLAGFV